MTAAAEPPRPHAIRTQNEQNNMKVPGSDALAGAENAITDKNLHMQMVMGLPDTSKWETTSQFATFAEAVQYLQRLGPPEKSLKKQTMPLPTRPIMAEERVDIRKGSVPRETRAKTLPSPTIAIQSVLLVFERRPLAERLPQIQESEGSSGY
jgi:hypothetical protein